MITTLLIDDEPLARQELASLLTHYPDIRVLAQCANAVEGIAAIHQHKPDLVFLDISMPKISGMEMLAMLDPDNLPKVVFVTAYDEYAVKAFENNAFDYLLKPIETERLEKCLERVRRAQGPQDLSPMVPEQLSLIPCYSGTLLKVLKVENVEYAYSDLGGVHVASADEVIHTQLTLKVLESRTPLLRCHRQYLIHPAAIAEIELQEGGNGEIHTQGGATLPVSRRYLKALKQTLGFQ
ncbi:two-component system response regulator BtsR [Ferrimonas sediminicola]|uniref:Two-component system response regulator BtsR n=1 Tax=Ferrimonas sediminicola TaxID=2569538 RepID=A0A4U1BJZ1_9GAMM|nr:two-component system response regulator BtsR [Ferrimonas sediminicola]TKB51532.1 two-component system response regulator BtsR [Ferrimonas sediminicola]